MILLRLAWKSLKNRLSTSLLTVIAISLSVFLLLAVEKVRRTTEESFTQSVSQVDLIVGARTGPASLVLFTVFNIGNATNNISRDTYLHWKQHPAVEWTIPYSLGDGHRGYRVVGTSPEFFRHYRFRGDQKPEFNEGNSFLDMYDVVLGSEVADALGYKLGSEIIVAHGVTRTEGVLHHDKNPFKVVGILKPTGTPIDRGLYISLQAMSLIHEDGAHHEEENHGEEQHDLDKISAFFVRTKSRIETLQLQRDINEYTNEPLSAVIPGVVLAELWQSMEYVEKVLKMISLMVILVGFFAMLIALLTTLNERRREMAVLRSLGASPKHIFSLLVFESFLLSFLGIVVGFAAANLLQVALGPWISQKTGLFLRGAEVSGSEWLYMLLILASGTLLGCLPALKAQKSSLKDGLSVRL
jgi:putative ABC transport system permease protein